MPGPRLPEDGSDALDPEQGGVLRGASPRELLFRLAEGDPLEIGARVEAVFEEEGLLLSTRRVQLRSLGEIAYAACLHGAPQELGPWLRERIGRAIESVLTEDREAERNGAPPGSAAQHLPMVAAFGVEDGLARRASVAFHSLPARQRRIVRGLVADGAGVPDLARAAGRSVDEVRSDLRSAIESLERAIGTRLAERLEGGDRG